MRETFRRSLVAIAAVAFSMTTIGCSAPRNPSFDLSLRQARVDLDAMRSDRRPLERPLVVLSGYGDPGLAAGYIRGKLELVVEGDVIVDHAPAGCDTFDDCRAELIEVVEGALAADGRSIETTEVDIVANSMGGLVAAYAAAPIEGLPRLRVRRLFTISSPFLGARMAELPALGDMPVDMRPESAFTAMLGEHVAARDYALYPYARLGDTWVGVERTAPEGEVPWWVSNAPFEPAHMTAFTDPRIRADIVRRLRGEAPYATEPRAPLPE